MTHREAMLSEWSVFGNRLLFLDLQSAPVPGDADLADLACSSLARTGADSLIVLLRGEALAAAPGIDAPGVAAPDVDALVRILEPDGSESLSCGNGLLCTAALLRLRGAALPAGVLTGIPSGSPWPVEIGVREGGGPWLRHSLALPVPDRLYTPAEGRAPQGCVDMVGDLGRGAEDVPPGILGRLVLTGEPHLVVFADEAPAGDWLCALGLHLNTRRRDLFPRGVNVDLVLDGGPEDGVRYRCFERGVNRETGACGTGAMAVASVWRLARGRVDALRVRPKGAPSGDGYMVRFARDSLLLSGRALLQSEAALPKRERTSLISSVS
ncbi:diaminopimelate epimerase [Desulfocurvus sp. DL9XJH121]